MNCHSTKLNSIKCLQWILSNIWLVTLFSINIASGVWLSASWREHWILIAIIWLGKKRTPSSVYFFLLLVNNNTANCISLFIPMSIWWTQKVYISSLGDRMNSKRCIFFHSLHLPSEASCTLCVIPESIITPILLDKEFYRTHVCISIQPEGVHPNQPYHTLCGHLDSWCAYTLPFTDSHTFTVKWWLVCSLGSDRANLLGFSMFFLMNVILIYARRKRLERVSMYAISPDIREIDPMESMTRLEIEIKIV